MDLKQTYDRIARDWLKDHNSDTWWIEGTDAFIALLGKNAAVLDVGCGVGFKSRYLKDHALQVTGSDFSEGMIAVAREQNPDIVFTLDDIRKPLSHETQFDGVFAQAVLLHIPHAEIQQVVNNLGAAVKQGGYLYAAVKGVKEGTPIEAELTENDYGYEFTRFFSYYTMPEMKHYFENAGFDSVWSHEALVRKTTWIQVIGKKRA